MVRRLLIALIAITGILVLTSGNVFASSNSDSGQETVSARHSILTLRESAQQGIITNAQMEKGIRYYLDQASQTAGRTLTLDEVLAAPDIAPPTSLTPLQQFAGLITFVSTLWVLAIVIGVASFAYLFGSYVKQLLAIFLRIPPFAYEALFYALSAGFLTWGWTLEQPPREYIGLTGCLLFVAALGFTCKLRRFSVDWSRFSAIVFAVTAAVAVIYSSSLIGFIAVGALLSAISSHETHHWDDWGVSRPTIAAFVLLAIFVPLRLFGTRIPGLAVFDFGSLFLGSFVGYSGLLILSNSYYHRRDSVHHRYLWYQIGTIIAGLMALLLGSVFQIPELQKIGGTFFVLYLGAKIIDIPAKSRRGYAAVGLLLAAVFFGFCLFVFSHQAILRPFLFISG
jgi:hypothetical protein